MENLVTTYTGRKVFVTGHTGFKGRWLCHWMELLGAEVRGLSLENGDVRNPEDFKVILDWKPDFVFHLAAQPIVLESYVSPIGTLSTNAMGTANVLHAVSEALHDCFVVLITSDKCYENTGSIHGYRETDALGGFDPYSASKACAEIIAASYRRSFGLRVATARAGNVIGGGDWSAHRLVPDCIRALSAGNPIELRNRNSRRSWIHVLDVLNGYLMLGAALARDDSYAEPFNFGSPVTSNHTAGEVVDEILKHWPGDVLDMTAADALREAHWLNLCSDKAFHRLGWKPKWDFETSIEKTVECYQAKSLSEMMTEQILRHGQD